MSVSLNTTQVSFTGYRKERTKEQKDAEKKVVTGGGALAATASAARMKGAKSMLDSAKKVSEGLQGVTHATQTINNVAVKSRGLWAKVGENVKWARDYVINFGSKIANIKILKPIVESKAFRGCAGFLGYGFGAVTLISGGADIFRVATDSVQNNLKKN